MYMCLYVICIYHRYRGDSFPKQDLYNLQLNGPGTPGLSTRPPETLNHLPRTMNPLPRTINDKQETIKTDRKQ